MGLSESDLRPYSTGKGPADATVLEPRRTLRQ